jgi:hypothetical protein
MFHMEISDKLQLLTQIHSTNRMCAAFTLFERAEFLHVDFSQCVLHGSAYLLIKSSGQRNISIKYKFPLFFLNACHG